MKKFIRNLRIKRLIKKGYQYFTISENGVAMVPPVILLPTRLYARGAESASYALDNDTCSPQPARKAQAIIQTPIFFNLFVHFTPIQISSFK